MSVRWSRLPSATSAAPLLVAAGAVAAVLVLTLPFGPARTPDSATYVAAARSLQAGRGYLDVDGASPMLDFPPLYPALLAFGGLLGASITATAIALGAVGLGACPLRWCSSGS